MNFFKHTLSGTLSLGFFAISIQAMENPLIPDKETLGGRNQNPYTNKREPDSLLEPYQSKRQKREVSLEKRQIVEDEIKLFEGYISYITEGYHADGVQDQNRIDKDEGIITYKKIIKDIREYSKFISSVSIEDIKIKMQDIHDKHIHLDMGPM